MSRRWSGRSFPRSGGHRSTFQVGLQARRVLKVASSEGGSLRVGAQHLHPLQVRALHNKSTVTQERAQEEGGVAPRSALPRLTSRLAPDRSARSRLEQHRLACIRLQRLRLAILKLM